MDRLFWRTQKTSYEDLLMSLRLRLDEKIRKETEERARLEALERERREV